MKSWYIYALIDPRTEEIRYIGWSVDVEKRLGDHCSEARRNRKTYKDKWICSLLSNGLKPIYRILEHGTKDWASAEQKWITHFRSDGARLVNGTDGGQGGWGRKLSAATRAHLSAVHKGKKMPYEGIQKSAAAQRGKVISADVRRRISLALKGITRSDETRANMVKAQKEVHKCPDLLAMKTARLNAINEARKGSTLPEEHRQKISAGLRAAWVRRKSGEVAA